MYSFAIIGCGNVASRHAESIKKTGKLQAVCDTDKQRADRMAKEYGVKAYYSADELLASEKNTEVVSICTPNGFHAEHSIKSLQAGKHVLCEQPFCLTSAGAWQTVETEKYTGKKLRLVPPQFSTGIISLHKDLRDKTPDKPLSFNLTLSAVYQKDDPGWKYESFPGGGLLYTLFFPYVQVLTFLFGNAITVHGSAGKIKFYEGADSEGYGVALLELENDISGSLHWSMGNEDHAELTVVTGKKLVRLGKKELLSAKKDYDEVYRDFTAALDKGSGSTIFEGVKMTETLEKIYKGISFITS